MRGLRIGVNALYLIPGGVGGTEIYLRSLLRALAHVDQTNEYFVFTNQETGASLVPEAPNFFLEEQALRAVNRPARLLWEQTILPREAKRLALDCLFNPGFTAPFRSPCPNVTVFHDLQHKRHPEHFRWWDLPFWRLFLRASVMASKHLIAVSEATKADLKKFYSVPDDRITVVPHGVDPVYLHLLRRPEVSRPFLLCVSTLHPHKNLERLVRVFARFHKAQPEYRLVLAGMRGFHTEPVEKAIAENGLTDAVEITGWLPEADLHDLYRTATAFCYPSTFEGFGMPVLEAMAAGIPLACARIPPLEWLAQDTAVLFDPYDEAAMLRALEEIVSGSVEVHQRIRRARERAAEFTWTLCAEKTLEVLRSQAVRGRTPAGVAQSNSGPVR
jgi:glycosyltransferase involved in cell wall biosynthesis